jgi:hypothetical protein
MNVNVEQREMLRQLQVAAKDSNVVPVMRAQQLLDRVMLEHGRAAAVRAVAGGIECSWGDVVVVAGVDRTALHTRLANGTVVMEEATFERLSAALG